VSLQAVVRHEMGRRLAGGATGWLTCKRLAEKNIQQAPERICQPLAVGVSLEGRPALQLSPEDRTKTTQNLQKMYYWYKASKVFSIKRQGIPELVDSQIGERSNSVKPLEPASNPG
jgi:hypothetical protein